MLVGLSLVDFDETNQLWDETYSNQSNWFDYFYRTIRTIYKNASYKDKLNWPEGFGQLTNVSELNEMFTKSTLRIIPNYITIRVSTAIDVFVFEMSMLMPNDIIIR